jgi:hypothetical protein
MPFDLYTAVALAQDLPEEGLRRGDVATIVDRVHTAAGDEGYLLEVFNALGQTLKVVAVPASALQPLSAGQILTVRPFAPSGTS